MIDSSYTSSLNFLKVICYLFILYNIENMADHISLLGTNKKVVSIGYERYIDLILMLKQYANNHYQFLLSLGTINIFGITSSYFTLKLFNWGRICLILSFYIVIIISTLILIHDIALLYTFIKHVWPIDKSYNILFGYSTYCIFYIIYILTTFWIIRKLKSHEIKILFNKKALLNI